MEKQCQHEGCQAKRRAKDEKFCLTHARQLLRSLSDSGYLEPLSYRTSSGLQVLSSRPFLTIEEESQEEKDQLGII